MMVVRPLKRSFFCDHVEVVELTTNLRFLTEGRSDESLLITFLINLNATNGHGNGTHHIIVSLYDNVIETEVASGPYAGSTLLIPRIPHVSQEMEFTITCKQFPIKLAFALTCNKAPE
uniref:Uncharacterized protein n=1 Tax=Octopus bimaculoides TaxID=37653 RepID=A0A0L8H5D4_OCTBM